MSKAERRFAFEPDFIVSPGEVLQETIEALGMTQSQLATRLGLTRKTVNLIIQGHEPISHETALRLERVTSVPAHFWNNLEAKYREKRARQAERERSAEDLEWLKSIPTKELVKRGAIQTRPDQASLLEEVLKFFGVNSPQEWKAVWSSFEAAFRKSEAFEAHVGALAAWLRLGELESHKIRCCPFDKDRFRAALDQIRALTVERPEVFVPRMKDLCAAAGVAFVLVHEIKGAPVSGATQWLSPEKALIQMTLRGKTNDLFWFTFFHEAGHILKHGKKQKFVDDGDLTGQQEEEANSFAADLLIPRNRANELRGLRARPQIVEFASSLGIAPGIVLGRMQKENLTDYRNSNNDLKVRLCWADAIGSAVAVADEVD